MKKKILAAVLGLAVAYFTMTPFGSVRLRVRLSGYPVSAATLRVAEKQNRFYVAENQKGYTLENPPYEKDTDSELYNWVATKHGVFYIGSYYGWG